MNTWNLWPSGRRAAVASLESRKGRYSLIHFPSLFYFSLGMVCVWVLKFSCYDYVIYVTK